MKKDGHFRGKYFRGHYCCRRRNDAGYNIGSNTSRRILSACIYPFSILTSTLLFAVVYNNPEILHSQIKSRYYDKIMLWCDTAGLGIFTVVGIQTASRILPQDNTFFFIFIGVLTGVGGGVLRDIMAGETPYILVREIYASAAIAGGVTCVVCRNSMGEATGIILGLVVTVVVRSLAAYFHWNLLRIK